MKPRNLLAYWLIIPIIVAGYIVAMANVAAKEKRDEGRGPHAYADPNGNAWGFGHGKGKPDKLP